LSKTTFTAAAGALALTILAGCGAQTFAPISALAPAASQPGLAAMKATLAKRFLVGFKTQPTAAQMTQLEATGAKTVKSLKALAMVVVEAGKDAKSTRQALLGVQGVQFVEAELLPEVETVKFTPADSKVTRGGDPLRNQQWGLDNMGVPKVWAAAGNTLKTIKVALIDTGVDLNHPDLKANLLEGANFDQPGQPPQDQAGHGTMTAGCIAAVANNGIGVVGVAPNAKIIPVKVGNSASSVCEAMMWAADHGDMISMSLSFKPNMSEYPVAVESTKRAAQYVMNKKIPMVCSMGNTGTESKNVPSAFAGSEVPGLIAVGATDSNDKVTSFSTFGNWTSISAPGKDIMTTNMGGKWGAVSGTSFSTPLTAGVVALMLGKGQAADPAAIKAKLQKTALDIEAPGYDNKAGWGRVDAFKAVMQ
jgi:subtilisin family serine protease